MLAHDILIYCIFLIICDCINSCKAVLSIKCYIIKKNMVDTIRAMSNESITQIGKGKKKLGRKTFNRVDFGDRRIKLRLQRHLSCVIKLVLNLNRYPKTDP